MAMIRSMNLLLCCAGAETYLGGFALGRSGDLEEIARLEIEHAGDDVRREFLNFGIQIADYRVVITARVLNGVFESD